MEFKSFGDWLRYRRLELDLSPFEMIAALGYKRVSSIYNFEYGIAPLPLTKWPVMAQLLQLSLDAFLTLMEKYEPKKVSEFRALQGRGGQVSPSETPVMRGAHHLDSMEEGETISEHDGGRTMGSAGRDNGDRGDVAAERYRVLPGPEAFLPPAAATVGIVLPDPGQGHIEGRIVPEEEAMEYAARKFLGAKVPTIFPGPLVLWHWNEKAAKKAQAIRVLANALPARIIPMADYRPKYPKIDAAVEINPNHPNLTIWHNKIDVCMFVGVHCHQANLALKIIRGGTNCFTIAMCAQAGHEDANLSFRDATPEKILRLAEWVTKLKAGGVTSQATPFMQFAFSHGKRIA